MTHLSDQSVAARVSSLIQAIANCERSGNTEWRAIHAARLASLVRNAMPSGSGFDAGTTLDDASDAERLIFRTSFHHMDEHGGYDGWTEHTVTARPSFLHGARLTISGRNRNDIKEHIHDAFSHALFAISREQWEQ